jgi:two-component system invasion response regulator UvrY
MKDTALIKVVCVDDNPAVTSALESLLSRERGFEWKGALASADQLIAHCVNDQPDLMLLDMDMPGRNPLDAMVEMVAACPGTRGIMFSGYVGRELIERSLNAGAWGYVSKNDGQDELLKALRKVAAGEVGLSPEAQTAYGG